MRARAVTAIAIAAAFVVALPAAAAVRNEHTFKLTLTAKKPSKSTGVTFFTDRTNYTAPPAGTQPVTITRTVFALPAGTKIRTSVATPCSIATLTSQGSAGCKPGTSIGTGSAQAITPIAALNPVKEQVAVYATKTGMAAYLTGLQTAVIPLSVKGNKLTANLPRFCLPPGTPANNCASGEAVLKTLTIKIRQKSKGGKNLVTTPRTCIGGKWTSRATYTFAGGDTEVKTSTSRCSK